MRNHLRIYRFRSSVTHEFQRAINNTNGEYDLFSDQSSQTAFAFRSSDYPRSYAMSTVNRTLWTFFAVVLGIPSLIMVLAVSLSWYKNGAITVIEAGILLFALGLFAFSQLFFWNAYRCKLVLRADRIELRGVKGEIWSMNRDRIGSWRLSPKLNTEDCIELTSIDPGVGMLSFPLNFKPDAMFDSWFADLTNSGLVQATEEVLQDTSLGGTPEERLSNVARASSFMKTAHGMMTCIMLWAIFYPRPYLFPVWICVAVPWMAIIAPRLHKGLSVGAGTPEKGNVTILILVSGIGLVMRILHGLQEGEMAGYNMLHWTQAIAPGIVVGLLMTVLAGLSNNWFSKSMPKIIGFVFIFSFYATPVIILTNALIDQSVPVNYPVKVLARHISTGKNRTDYLTVSPWGPQISSQNIAVNYAYYGSKTEGDVICVSLHSGAYRMPWYSLNDCSPILIPK